MENKIDFTKNMLVWFQVKEDLAIKYMEIKEKFCGKVIYKLDDIKQCSNIYLCGNIELINSSINYSSNANYYIVDELSYNNNTSFTIKSIGQIPLNYYNVGVLYKNIFGRNYFNDIESNHVFQELTESNKPSKAFRK